MKKAALTYLGSLENVYHIDKQLSETEMAEMLAMFKKFSSYFSLPQFGFYVLDYTTRSYKLIGESLAMLLGLEPDELLKSGLTKVLEIYHPNDFSLVNGTVFPKTLQFLKNTPFEEHGNFLFTYTYRLKHANGNYVTVLQKCKFITSKENNLPLYSFGTVQDITGFDNTGRLVYMVDRVDNTNLTPPINVHTEYFSRLHKEGMLTKRQLQILNLMTKGMVSKEIAEALHIDKDTVDTHRKSMLQRTNCKNVAELVHYAKNEGLI